MTVTWTIFSPLSLAEANRVDSEMQALVASVLDAHPEREVDWFFHVSTRMRPLAERLAEWDEAEITPEIRARLDRCALMFVAPDAPLNLALHPWVPSLLMALLERVGAGVVDWGGITLGGPTVQTCEDAITTLTALPRESLAF